MGNAPDGRQYVQLYICRQYKTYSYKEVPTHDFIVFDNQDREWGFTLNMFQTHWFISFFHFTYHQVTVGVFDEYIIAFLNAAECNGFFQIQNGF